MLCHPACPYRKLKRGKGIFCTSQEAECSFIPHDTSPEWDGFFCCPTFADYWNHMSCFYTELRTERELIRLRIVSGEAMLVYPTLWKYMDWLHKRRRSVRIVREPVNERDLDYYISHHDVDEAIYSELFLEDEAIREIKEAVHGLYPIVEAQLPEELREASLRKRKAVEEYRQFRYADRHKPTEAEEAEITRLRREYNYSEFDLKDAYDKAWHEWEKSENKLPVDMLYAVRNYFWGWQ